MRYDTEVGEFDLIVDILPPAAKRSVYDTIRKYNINSNFISEIRLRCGRCLSLVTCCENIGCLYIVKEDDIKNILRRICCDSVYAFSNTIKQGYIPLPCGGRAGVVGDVTDSEKGISVDSISSVNFRIPHHIRGVCGPIYKLFKKYRKGIMIYSPPAVGKTTLLRDLAIELSRGQDPMKVALIDTRREIDNGKIPNDCHIDTYPGYPKSLGIEIAHRTMASDVILCDEISYEETEAVKHSMLSGVPIIAAAHAYSSDELMRRCGFVELIDMGAFSFLVGIKRRDKDKYYTFDIRSVGENNVF